MGVKSAVRVLQLLEAFGEAQRPLRLKEVAAMLNYPTSSTSALLKSVAECGYLSYDQNTHRYHTTSRLPDLGQRFGGSSLEAALLSELMQAVSRRTGELIVAGTSNDIYVEYIRAIRSTHAVQLYSPAGTRRLLVQSGMGWMLLSRLAEGAVRRIYRRTLAAGSITTSEISEEALVTRLSDLRGKDVLFTNAEDFARVQAHTGGAMLSMPIPATPNNRRLVLGVGGPSDRLRCNQDAIVTCMREEIQRLAA